MAMEYDEAVVARARSPDELATVCGEVDEDDDNEVVCCREYANNEDQGHGDAVNMDEARCGDDDDFRECEQHEVGDRNVEDGRMDCGDGENVNDRDDDHRESCRLDDDDGDHRRRLPHELGHCDENLIRHSMLLENR